MMTRFADLPVHREDVLAVLRQRRAVGARVELEHAQPALLAVDNRQPRRALIAGIPKTADRLGVKLGDVVEIASTVGALHAPVFVNPAIAPDIVAMPVGQGHTTFTRYASGRGVNPVDILAPVAHADTGTLAWAATRVKVTRTGDPDGSLIMFSARGELRENPWEGSTR